MDRTPRNDSDRARSPVYADGGDQQVDRLLEALGTYRRRCVLYHLKETEPTELEKVARAVGANLTCMVHVWKIGESVTEMGLEKVANVEGGFNAWKEAGGPVDEPKPSM